MPTGYAFDAIYQDQLQADQIAVIPNTRAGEYYILIRGNSEPSAHTPVTLLAEVAPFVITKVVSDQGGDSRWVTVDVYGTKFAANAILKFVRPGIAEFEPIVYEVINSTHIRATFDFTGAPHGLYDVIVRNPDGQVATEAYRYLIERAVEPDATIGLGGPRVVLAGDTNNYSVSFQSLANLDTPYVYFTYGVTYLGTNSVIYGLPYVTFATNLGGQPDVSNGTDVPWASLSSVVNTNGRDLAPGYLYNLQAGGFAGLTFNVSTYPGLRELSDKAWAEFRDSLYQSFPALRGQLDGGPETLNDIAPGLAEAFTSDAGVPPANTQMFIPFKFNVVAAATAMTREEFIARQRADAEALRIKVVADPLANPALLALAADKDAWVTASSPHSSRPDCCVPPIRPRRSAMDNRCRACCRCCRPVFSTGRPASRSPQPAISSISLPRSMNGMVTRPARWRRSPITKLARTKSTRWRCRYRHLRITPPSTSIYRTRPIFRTSTSTRPGSIS